MAKAKAKCVHREPVTTHAHYYCGLMLDAVTAVYSATRFEQEAKKLEDDAHLSGYPELAGVHCRYGFLMAMFAAEAGANALIETLPGASDSLVNDLEQMKTLNKYELFCLTLGRPLERSNAFYRDMLACVKLRNAIVHPKKTQLALTESPTGQIEPEEKIVGNRRYPVAVDFFEPKHAVDLVRDILAFVSWSIFDVCKLSIYEGATRLSRGYMCQTAYLVSAHVDLDYDIRSFGVEGKGHGAHLTPFPKHCRRVRRGSKSV